MDNKKNGIPKLRFPGFTGAWEQRKLGEVATFINGRAYKQNELLDSGKYKVLRVGNFYTNDSWYYSNLELADKYYIDEGDLVYTWSATFGPHIWNGEKVIYHYHIWKIELSKFLDRDFTLQILEADKAKLLANTNGSTMIHVTKKDMESKVISLPNIEEQKKIGSYLMKFDSLITLHQRKLEHLQEQKKGLLQKMFPKNGETVPEVRFPGFTDTWEQRKLGKVVELYGGNAFSSKDSTTDGIPWLKISNVSTNGIDWETKSFLPTNYWKKYPEYQLKKGDYVMALTRPVLNHALKIGKVDRPSLLNQRVAKLKFKFNREFTFQLLRRQQVVLRIENELAGTDPPNLGSRNLMQVNITLPINIHEQQKIGEYFSKFDSLIALHQRKLDHLELMKKGLLQQMFV